MENNKKVFILRVAIDIPDIVDYGQYCHYYSAGCYLAEDDKDPRILEDYKYLVQEKGIDEKNIDILELELKGSREKDIIIKMNQYMDGSKYHNYIDPKKTSIENMEWLGGFDYIE